MRLLRSVECRYLDRLFEIVRPRKLIYLAVDGVAPRAKMNQQRSRRFSAFQVRFLLFDHYIQERQDRKDAEDDIRSRMLAAGKKVPPPRTSSFDSNKITPGTEYMMEICDNLRWYIADRMSHNPAWQNVTVILSDGSVPGEGEHKIMDFIRRERAQPGYDPNTKRCRVPGSSRARCRSHHARPGHPRGVFLHPSRRSHVEHAAGHALRVVRLRWPLVCS